MLNLLELDLYLHHLHLVVLLVVEYQHLGFLPIFDFHHKVHTLRFVALYKPSSFRYFSYVFVMFNFCYISISAKYFH